MQAYVLFLMLLLEVSSERSGWDQGMMRGFQPMPYEEHGTFEGFRTVERIRVHYRKTAFQIFL